MPIVCGCGCDCCAGHHFCHADACRSAAGALPRFLLPPTAHVCLFPCALLSSLQLGYALKQGIPYLVLFGEAELEQGVVKIKDLDANTEEVVAQVGGGGWGLNSWLRPRGAWICLVVQQLCWLVHALHAGAALLRCTLLPPTYCHVCSAAHLTLPAPAACYCPALLRPAFPAGRPDCPAAGAGQDPV